MYSNSNHLTKIKLTRALGCLVRGWVILTVTYWKDKKWLEAGMALNPLSESKISTIPTFPPFSLVVSASTVSSHKRSSHPYFLCFPYCSSTGSQVDLSLVECCGVLNYLERRVLRNWWARKTKHIILKEDLTWFSRLEALSDLSYGPPH